MGDEPMDQTGPPLFRLDQRRRMWETCAIDMSLTAAPAMQMATHSHHITAFSLGRVVSSYPLPFDTFLSIRGVCYQRADLEGL